MAVVAIVGTGLIGTSIGLALRQRSKRTTIVGLDRRRAAVRAAKARGALTAISADLEMIRQADVTVLATPLPATLALLPAVLRLAVPGSFVIDVASLKKQVVDVAAAQGPLAALFIGGHPLAGSESAGPQGARSDLFAGRPFALCPVRRQSSHHALLQARRFVRLLGATPVVVDAALHDRIVAATSALPQVGASAATLAIDGFVGPRTHLYGPGFESFTRLARSPADLWAWLLLANRRNVVPVLDVFESQIRRFRKAIEGEDIKSLGRLLRSGAATQRRLRSN